jgi:hypothetical protein
MFFGQFFMVDENTSCYLCIIKNELTWELKNYLSEFYVCFLSY